MDSLFSSFDDDEKEAIEEYFNHRLVKPLSTEEFARYFILPYVYCEVVWDYVESLCEQVETQNFTRFANPCKYIREHYSHEKLCFRPSAYAPRFAEDEKRMQQAFQDHCYLSLCNIFNKLHDAALLSRYKRHAYIVATAQSSYVLGVAAIRYARQCDEQYSEILRLYRHSVLQNDFVYTVDMVDKCAGLPSDHPLIDEALKIFTDFANQVNQA